MRRQTSVRMRLVSMLLICAVALSGCSAQDTTPKETAEIFAMNTIMNLTVYGENASEVLQDARGMVQKYEQLFSVNIETSDVAKLNNAGGQSVQVSEETYDVLQRSIQLSQQTEGFFDVSIYPLVRAWGFTTESYRVPEEKEIQEILQHIDYRNILLGKENMVTIPADMQIDLGAIAKGYLSQKLIELFEEKQVTAAVVSLGGNVQTYGRKPDGTAFQVGITDPIDGVSVYGGLEVGEKAVVTSGSYQRYFEQDGKQYHHIMDKRTGAPAESDLKSVTVIANRGDVADSLATALFVMGKEKAIAFDESHDEVQLILIDSQNQVWTSEGLVFEKVK